MPPLAEVTALYPRLLGARFAKLAAAVQRFHGLQGAWRIPGRCTIGGATHPLTRMLARLLGLPRASGEAPFEFDLVADADGETWIRRFPDHVMRSRLCAANDGRLAERLGPARLHFRLAAENGVLVMTLDRIRVFGLPWPRRAFPAVRACERGDDARFHFDIEARFGRLGLLVAYHGHLDLDRAQALT